MPFRTVVLKFGYVESTTAAVLVMTVGQEGLTFPTEREAVESLALDFWAKYKADGHMDPEEQIGRAHV